MEKLLINLYVSVLLRDYDLLVPQEVKIQKVKDLIADGVAEMSRERFQKSGNEVLMREGAAKPLHPEKTLYDYDVRDGERLILI